MTEPQPDPAVMLTDAERDQLTQAHDQHDTSGPRLRALDAAVERIIAARTADTDARLAAVEDVLAEYDADPGTPAAPYTRERALRERLDAALSATAPDADADAAGLLDDYDPVPGLVARGVMADPEEEPTAPDAGQRTDDDLVTCPECRTTFDPDDLTDWQAEREERDEGQREVQEQGLTGMLLRHLSRGER